MSEQYWLKELDKVKKEPKSPIKTRKIEIITDILAHEQWDHEPLYDDPRFRTGTRTRWWSGS